MSRGFGATTPKRRAKKSSASQASKARQCDVEADTQISLEEDWKVNLEKQALAWYAGVYNPLAEIEPDRIRSIEADEEEWLFLAKLIGWLEVDDELDALYFTAPPPAFNEIQADWYLRPVVTTFLEEPAPLKDVMVDHPIPHQLVDQVIARHAKRLKWKPQRVATFIQEVSGKPGADDLLNEDYAAILLELQRL
jgi:hypothetical protein